MRAPLLSKSHRRRIPLSTGITAPSELSGLQLWLAARKESGYSDDDPVETLTDFSDNSVATITQGTAANRGLWKENIKNGLAAFLLDGSNDYWQGQFGFGLTQPIMVAAVAQLDATFVDDDNDHMLFMGTAADERMAFGQQDANSPNEWWVNSGNGLFGSASDGNWNIISVLYSGASSEIRINGSLVGSGNAGTEEADGITVGAYLPPGIEYLWKGYLAELVIYDPGLSDANLNLLGDLFSDLYDITWNTI